jgi:hypothetical protein
MSKTGLDAVFATSGNSAVRDLNTPEHARTQHLSHRATSLASEHSHRSIAIRRFRDIGPITIKQRAAASSVTRHKPPFYSAQATIYSRRHGAPIHTA